MKVIITGATGMVGGIVLNHCLASDKISKVVSISRKSVQITHSKLEEILHKDFSNFKGIEQSFENAGAAYFCLGVYTGAVSDDLFKKITFNFVASFADILKKKSPKATFCLLSGSGADQTEKSRVSFARYKGMAENYLIKKEFGALYLFRPGYIYPVEKRKSPNLMYSISRSLYPVLKLMGKKYSIKSTELGEAIFKAGIEGANKTILENQDILATL